MSISTHAHVFAKIEKNVREFEAMVFILPSRDISSIVYISVANDIPIDSKHDLQFSGVIIFNE